MDNEQKYDLLEFKTFTGKALSFLAQNGTNAEIDKVRNAFLDLDRQRNNVYGCLQVPTGTKKIGDILDLPWLKSTHDEPEDCPICNGRGRYDDGDCFVKCSCATSK